MTRPTASEQLSAWIDGELTDAEAAELEAELARDPSLRSELEELEAVVQLMHRDGPTSAPAGFEARVLARTDNERIPGLRLAWVRRPLGVPLEAWGLGLAVAAALLLTLVPALRSTSRSEAPEPAALDVRPFPTQAEPTVEPPGSSSAGGDAEQALVDHRQMPRAGWTSGNVGGVAEAPPTGTQDAAPIEQAPPPPPRALDAVMPSYHGTQRWVTASDDPAAKRDLLALLVGYGTVTDADGNPIDSATRLSGNEDLVLDLDLALHDFYGFQRDLEWRLGRLGFTSRPEGSDGLEAGRVKVVVSLQWKRDEQGTAAP